MHDLDPHKHPLVDLSLPVEAQEVVGEGFTVHQALQRAVHETGVSKVLKAWEGRKEPRKI